MQIVCNHGYGLLASEHGKLLSCFLYLGISKQQSTTNLSLLLILGAHVLLVRVVGWPSAPVHVGAPVPVLMLHERTWLEAAQTATQRWLMQHEAVCRITCGGRSR